MLHVHCFGDPTKLCSRHWTVPATSMSRSATLTLRSSPELKERLGSFAQRTNRTRSFLASESITDNVVRELRVLEGVQKGLDDMQAGRVVPHAEAMRRVRRIFEKASKNGA
jgi:predicted transcriptional regulator